MLALAIAGSFSASMTVTAEGAPDLVALGPNVSNSTPETGEAFWFIATVHSQGDTQSAATTVRYLRSTDATITTSDTLEGTDAVGPLGPLQNYAATIRLTAPSTAGTYYYGACIDAVTAESDTANNCSGAVAAQVKEASDGGGSGGTTDDEPEGAGASPDEGEYAVLMDTMVPPHESTCNQSDPANTGCNIPDEMGEYKLGKTVDSWQEVTNLADVEEITSIVWYQHDCRGQEVMSFCDRIREHSAEQDTSVTLDWKDSEGDFAGVAGAASATYRANFAVSEARRSLNDMKCVVSVTHTSNTMPNADSFSREIPRGRTWLDFKAQFTFDFNPGASYPASAVPADCD